MQVDCLPSLGAWTGRVWVPVPTPKHIYIPPTKIYMLVIRYHVQEYSAEIFQQENKFYLQILEHNLPIKRS